MKITISRYSHSSEYKLSHNNNYYIRIIITERESEKEDIHIWDFIPSKNNNCEHAGWQFVL
jgi:hypothetical protein